jgi:hypothetical protein
MGVFGASEACQFDAMMSMLIRVVLLGETTDFALAPIAAVSRYHFTTIHLALDMFTGASWCLILDCSALRLISTRALLRRQTFRDQNDQGKSSNILVQAFNRQWMAPTAIPEKC